MPYEGPGLYEHYKGHEYAVLGLALKEDTLRKPGQPEHDEAGPELQCVAYIPLSPGSILESREETIWLRERSDFDAYVEVGGKRVPRFRIITQYLNARISVGVV